MAKARFRRQALRFFVVRTILVTGVFLHSSTCPAQTGKPADDPTMKWLMEARDNPELSAALNRLSERLMREIQLPPPRGESNLLPALPETTIFYMGIPNYGEAVERALDIFKQEQQQSAPLRDWLQKGGPKNDLPVIETWVEKATEFLGYLGDEIVVSGSLEGKEPKFLAVARVRKPGVKNFLEFQLNELRTKSNPAIRLLDPQELPKAEDQKGKDELVILVRPDFLAAGMDVETLRRFNSQISMNTNGLASTEFGERVAEAYQGGVTGVGAVDVHRLLSLIPPGAQKSQMVFQSSGFADMKYAEWERKKVEGQNISQGELSFTGPRHGVASWLAVPSELSSLDFVSPNALIATAFVLKRPVEIFDDVKEMSEIENPQAFAMLPQFEQGLNISIKDDLLAQLSGELAFELDDFSKNDAAWKAFAQVNDAEHLQKTLATLMAVGKVEEETTEDGGIRYHTIHIPTAKKPYEIDYAFADGQLIAGPSRELVGGAIRAHRSGESLGKSSKFLAALPPGHPSGESAVFYEEPVGFMKAMMRIASPDVASLIQLEYAGKTAPVGLGVYGSKSAIREESTNVAFDTAIVAAVAAIAIPNLLKSKMAANEASAVGSLRSINTAEVTYFATYREKGYAPDMAKLGEDPGATQPSSVEHAGYLNSSLANPSCTGGAWCTKAGYRFIIKATCKGGHCDDYAVTATPVASDTGKRNFCSTSDGVIRFNNGAPLVSALTIPECASLQPLQ